MADKVIVVGVRRGRERVPTSEIIQMIGRAGRKHDGSVCYADIVAEDDLVEDVASEIEEDKSVEVVSQLNTADNLAFHMLPDICSGRVRDRQSMSEWYNGTFAAFQGMKASLDKTIELLEASEAIRSVSGRYVATGLGNVAAKLYFNPADVKAWHSNFDMVFQMGLENDDLALAWALGNVPVTRRSGDFGNRRELITDCMGNIPPGLEVLEGSRVTVALWWSVLGGPSAGKMRNQMLNLRDDFGRIHRALCRIDAEVAHWDRQEFFNDLKHRIAKGIPSQLEELCKIPGITKSRADYLYSIGIRDRHDIREMVESLEGEVDERFMDVLRTA